MGRVFHFCLTGILAFAAISTHGTAVCARDDGTSPAGREKTAVPNVGYLIVVADALAPAADPLAAWKRKQGFKVLVTSTTTTGKTVEKIKAYIQKQYDSWRTPNLTYVLLIGDTDTIPADIGRLRREQFATDLTYSKLKGNDLLPDVGLGRLPARTENEAREMIARTMAYEKGDFPSTEWISRAAFITSSSFHKQCEDTAEYCVRHTKAAGYKGSFPKPGQPGGDLLYAKTHQANTAALKSVFDRGCGIIVYQGHAVQTGWKGPVFDQSAVGKISHECARPFVVSISCLSGSYAWKRDSLGETWMKEKHGAIAFFGASANSLFPHCLTLQKGVFDAIFRDGERTLSGICNAGKLAVRRKHGGQGAQVMDEMYNLLGDPSLKLRIPEARRAAENK